MKTPIIGADGSMGKRYQTILRYLDQAHVCADKNHSKDQIMDMAMASDSIILTTPTDTHVDYLFELVPLKKPILCEKPISKNMKDLDSVLAFIKCRNDKFSMMNQYKLIDCAWSEGESYYNYFRHGSDGLLWDCIQIVGLARGKVTLGQSSPMWQCMLNGRKLESSWMDWAYVQYVDDFLHGKYQDINEIRNTHEKVVELEKKGLWDYFSEATSPKWPLESRPGRTLPG